MKCLQSFALYWPFVWRPWIGSTYGEKLPGLTLLVTIYQAGDLVFTYTGATMPTHWTSISIVDDDYLGLNIRFAISEVKALHGPLSTWCKQSLIIHLRITVLQQFVATNERNIQIQTFDSVITIDFYHLAEARHKLLKSFEGHHTAGIWASQVPPVAI